jgi:hypothetical protein
MKKSTFLPTLISALAVASFATLTPGQSDVPLLISYQGELTSPTTGQPVADGSYDMVFEIFTEQTRGFSLWRGRHTATRLNPVEVKDGIFNVILGSGTGNALEPSLFDGAERWLEITIEGETLEPRQRITSVAYSMVSDNSRLLEGKSAGDFVISGGIVEAEKVVYPIPREHVLSVGPEQFAPSFQHVGFTRGGLRWPGIGITDTAAGKFAVCAPVNLPHGAVVTEFTAHFWDVSTHYIVVDFYRRSWTAPLAEDLELLATADSRGLSAFASDTDAQIENALVDNRDYSYVIIGYVIDRWDAPDTQIVGATITYTISEAP